MYAQTAGPGVLPGYRAPAAGGTVTSPILLPDGSASAPSIAFTAATNSGIFRDGSARVGISVQGNENFYFGSSADFNIGNDAGMLRLGGSNDVVLARDAANTLALKNGTNAQQFNLYFNATTNKRIGFAAAEDGVLQLKNFAGTGFTRLILGTNDTTVSGASWVLDSGTLDAKTGDGTSLTQIHIASGGGNNTPPVIVATTGLLSAQGANVATTTIPGASSVASGLYEVCAATAVTRAATTSSTLPSVSILWNNGVAQGATAVSANSGNLTTTVMYGCVVVHASASTAIQYSTAGYATSGATSMQYELWVTVRAIY